ncbi:MAG: ornithine carbamoyltransferase [Omnitrophica bacterium RIFCSPLOWO2_01_FULL_45_24]|nr:MAG: ornithine carbamoyltransferase [Omnitrophica bacterium RIFCSPHIGHO2_02_FULL_46_20]OGW93572.1 MAG: ornithine carbamoyltransferase [Omnitrophica bacterium RIFCSPLOWO2_01_FULL_45_24]
MKKMDLLSIGNISNEEINEILDLGKKVKKDKAQYAETLKGKSIGLVFQKPSNRTRVSFEIGMVQLGGYAIYLGPSEIGMGGRESVKDVANVLSRYLDGLIARTYKHADLEDLAKHATVPVINGLSDYAHPCQALSDIFTIKEKFGTFKGITLSYIGDANNVLNSLMCASAKIGLNIKIATPKGYKPDKRAADAAKSCAAVSGARIEFSHDPKSAAKAADIIYTDVWVSMGQEKEAKKRMRDFNGFQINDNMMKLTNKNCLVMHCLPAHRGDEITDSVIDSKYSVIYDQAENRMHIQKAILLKLLA